jgi:hypothetical protein
MPDAKYLLDSSVLIEAHQRYYAFDLAPAFWNAIKNHCDIGRIYSIDRIKEELKKGNDELANWSCAICEYMFLDSSEANVLNCYARIMNWAQGQNRLTQAAINGLAQSADGWLIAYAMAKGYTVVTQEVSAMNSKTEVKIPDLCGAMGVPCMDTFDMLRTLGIKFR